MKKTLLLALGGAFLTFFVGYFPGWFDSGEFATAAAHLGVSHATGHPSYLLVANLFSQIPIGTVAFRTSIVSVLGAVISTWMIFEILRLLGVGHFLAFVTSFLFLLHPSVALQITRTEVYSLECGLSLLMIYVGLRLYTNQDAREAMVLFFVGGYLAALQPLLTTCLAPTLLLPLIHFPRRIRIISVSISIFLLGFLTNLYLPLRALRQPVVNWDNPSSFESLYKLLTARDFAVFFHSPVSSAGLRDWLAGDLLQLIPVTILGLTMIGLAALWKTQKRSVFIYLFCVWALALVPWLAKDFHLQNPDSHAYVMLPIALTLVIATLGLHHFPYRLPSALAPMLLILFFTPLIKNGVNALSAHAAIDADLLSRHLDIAPPQAAIELNSDHWLFPIWYRTYVEGRRPDVAVISRGLVNASWYRNKMTERYGIVKKRMIWEETSSEHSRPLVGFLIGKGEDSAMLQNSFLDRCHTILKRDPFEISSSVCAQVIQTAALETAVDERGVWIAIDLLERILDQKPSDIRCYPLRPIQLPYPLSNEQPFLPDRKALLTSLSRFYIGCGKTLEAEALLKEFPNDVNGRLLLAALVWRSGKKDEALDLLKNNTTYSRGGKNELSVAHQKLIDLH